MASATSRGLLAAGVLCFALAHVCHAEMIPVCPAIDCYGESWNPDKPDLPKDLDETFSTGVEGPESCVPSVKEFSPCTWWNWLLAGCPTAPCTYPPATAPGGPSGPLVPTAVTTSPPVVSAVPEPSSILLVGLGSLSLFLARRRR